MKIDRDAFVDILLAWFHARGARPPGFKPYWPVRGGWEAWIQVEIAAAILNRDPTADVQREVSIFTAPRERVDLLLNGGEPSPATLAVELKAQSFYNRTTFVAGALADVEKLADRRQPAWRVGGACALAIAFDPAAVDALTGSPVPTGWQSFAVLAVSIDGEVALLGSFTG